GWPSNKKHCPGLGPGRERTLISEGLLLVVLHLVIALLLILLVLLLLLIFLLFLLAVVLLHGVLGEGRGGQRESDGNREQQCEQLLHGLASPLWNYLPDTHSHEWDDFQWCAEVGGNFS